SAYRPGRTATSTTSGKNIAARGPDRTSGRAAVTTPSDRNRTSPRDRNRDRIASPGSMHVRSFLEMRGEEMRGDAFPILPARPYHKPGNGGRELARTGPEKEMVPGRVSL